MTKLLAKLRQDRSGSVIVEFAILGPAMLAMLFGVLQFGIGMQNYNALRSISADLARYAVIDAQDAAAQSDMTLRDTNDELEAYAREIASAAPYGLRADRLTVTVTSVPTRIDEASERTMTLQYNIPSVLGMIGIDSIPITYTRPVFIA
ncbi:MAG: pilus assembly protein [Novosphingobium sp.]|nr:pilus assembly protein [Novosphingobium sp.]